jgi:hypothetical protein
VVVLKTIIMVFQRSFVRQLLGGLINLAFVNDEIWKTALQRLHLLRNYVAVVRLIAVRLDPQKHDA